MSSGALDYTNLVVGPLTLSQGWRYYVDNLLVEEALSLAAAAGVDMAQFDSRKQRYIDAISIMYAGDTVWEGELWPHNSTIAWQFNGYRANMYQVTGLGLDASRLTIGTFCHESGHMLCRFPDLYDYGRSDGDFERSAGMGQYCLMSAGNHLDGGHTPSPICVYLRYLAGWCPNRILLFTRGDYEAKHGDYGTALIYETQRLNEYYLVENRSRIGLDAFLPSSGLAVYHCDIKGSNEWQGGSAQSHYQCGLLQADGHFDLEHNLNQGDPNDLFAQMQGEVLSDVTTPSTRMWDGSDSGFYVGDISAPGEKMTFRVI
jgi:M6 family metalloprotease-like protein